ncbi:MAG: FAD-dependent oxidoreductase, partial [Coriobacteriia bacterium]|nr:FAD-dependent oxidoreductase [Coriobacteriia bacterium]
FVYTNNDSLSLGLVVTIAEIAESSTPIYQMLEDFKNHPSIAPLVKGAKVLEHSGHMVSEGGYRTVPEYLGDGCLIAGDAAMLCMNLGYMVRGMDLAVASGKMAAEAACEAIDKEDTSKSGLAAYKEKMEASFVMQDLKTFQKWPHFMDGWKRLFKTYPLLAQEVFTSLFTVDGTPAKPLVKRLMPSIRRVGILNLLKDLRGALKAL